MAKYENICELMERRIRLGDYALKEIPPEDRLATEVGVSRMTARRAVLQLIDKGVLLRKPNGRVVVNREFSSGETRSQIALLMPAYMSSAFDRWRVSAERAASKLQTRVRKVDYVHWDDPTILETLDGFDGVFLVPSSEDVPPQVLQRIKEHLTPLVVLDTDWTEFGLRSIDLAPARHIRSLLNYLWDLGHRRIACLNTQPHDSAVLSRLEHRFAWESERGVKGRLIDEPVAPFEDPIAKGHEVMAKFLLARQPDFTAIITPTMGSAVGAMRALLSAGIKVGPEISICAMNDEGLASYLCPSLTCTRMPDAEPFLSVGYEWIMGHASWDDRLLLQPSSVSLFIGESTGPCRG